MIYPLLPVFLTTVLGAGMGFVGLVEGVAESASSLLKLFSGWISDRLGMRKKIVLGGYALSTLTRPLMAAATVPWHVLVIRFADRAGKGIRTSPRDALIAASSRPEKWGRSFGFHRGMDHTGAIIGPRCFWMLNICPGIIARSSGVLFPFFSRSSSCSGEYRANPPRHGAQSLSLAPFDRRFRIFLLLICLFTGIKRCLSDPQGATGQHPVAQLPLLWMTQVLRDGQLASGGIARG
jgi:MFS family permease